MAIHHEWMAGGPDFCIFIAVDNGGIDDIQHYELTSGSYMQIWDPATGGTLAYDFNDLWKITYNRSTAIWSVGDCSSCPPPLNNPYEAGFYGATYNVIGSVTPVGFATSFWNLSAPVDYGSMISPSTAHKDSWAYLFDHTGNRASNNPVQISGILVPEPVNSTLFVIGAATMGFRVYRKTFKK